MTICTRAFGIYLTGKIRHAPLFRQMRDEKKFKIVSRWIDVTDLDESNRKAVADLWDHTIRPDLWRTTHLVVYLPDEEVLKGGQNEIGAAWFKDCPIHFVSPLSPAQLRKLIGTLPASEKVTHHQHSNLAYVLRNITKKHLAP